MTAACLRGGRGLPGGLLLRGGGFVAADVGELLLDLFGEDVLRRALLGHVDLRRHRTGGLDAAQRHPHRLQRVVQRSHRRRRLVAAMSHTVRALLVLAGAVGFPVRGVHQLLEGLGIAFAEQIAGLLPAKNVARGHAPRRALVLLVAGEEVEEQAGMHKIPLLALAHRKDVAEQLLGLGAVEEVRLVRRALIGIAR